MMRYTVVWNQLALSELGEVWLAAKDRDAVSYACHVIDQELALNASLRGEALHEGLRVLWVAPLKVIFFVQEEDRMVEITTVRGE